VAVPEGALAATETLAWICVSLELMIEDPVTPGPVMVNDGSFRNAGR
jgi:hypothetical protein